MRPVILESPYAGEVERNTEYARRAVRHALSLGDAPLASHLLYTQPGILDDLVESERRWGIDAGLTWLQFAQASVLYIDYGISSGMKYGLMAAADMDVLVEFREIGENPELIGSDGDD
jgi:hypothetical protein